MLSVAKNANSDLRDQNSDVNEWTMSGGCQPQAWGTARERGLVTGQHVPFQRREATVALLHPVLPCGAPLQCYHVF